VPGQAAPNRGHVERWDLRPSPRKIACGAAIPTRPTDALHFNCIAL
jgi:hypothetical protein